MKINLFLALILGCSLVSACSDGSEADERGVGSECSTNEDCTEEGQECLAFKGGYCGIKDCEADEDCPEGSRCVTFEDSVNYCFLLCQEKTDCNINRTEENESNCVGSGTINFVESADGAKACEPPASDTTL